MTRDDLLAAVTVAPDDDTPRLAFADYLEDEGDADWAELIRLQVGFFRDWGNYAEQNRREAELIAATKGRFPDPPGCELGPPVRGFPMKLNALPHENPDYAAAFAWPVAWLRVKWWLPGFPTERFAGLEVLEFLPHHDAEGNEDALLFQFHALKHCDPARLRAFFWRGQGLHDADIGLIVDQPAFAGLQELDLSGNRFTDAALRRLISSPYFRSLRYLNLAGNRIMNSAPLERRFGPALRLV